MMPTIFSPSATPAAYVPLGHQLDRIEHDAVGAME